MIWTQALASLNPGHTARVSITTLVYIFVTILSIPQSCVYTTTNSKIKCLQLNTRSEKINVGSVANYTVTLNTQDYQQVNHNQSSFKLLLQTTYTQVALKFPLCSTVQTKKQLFRTYSIAQTLETSRDEEFCKPSLRQR